MSDKKKDNYEEANLASFWNFKFKDAMVQKADYTKRWQSYIDAYNGDYFKNVNLPDYKSDLVSNYIFSIIETIRPIMLDNDPKFQAMPRHPDGVDFSNDLQSALSYEWDREGMNAKLYRELINTLVIGNSVFFVPWDKEDKNVRATPVNPFNIFVDPLATSVDDAEYIIYATYNNQEVLKRSFPDKADSLTGGDINYGELVHDNNKDARVDNQILVLEVYTRDYETLEKDSEGNSTQKYPNGRVITLCPELGLVLSDKKNPYKDGAFPFLVLKDYDIPGKFWGEGEVAQLLSPQKYMNELNNSILDNAKTTANMPWIIDKNSGVGYGKITSRPGLIIRKNPGTEVSRPQPPSMPSYVANAVESYKHDMEQISGVFDTLKGDNATGVYTAQGILALQEAGQARVRLKVKTMEDFLGKLATLWYSRMRQFWTEPRWIRVTKANGTYDFTEIKSAVFDYDYDVRILAGSTMPVNRGAMLDLMIRLAQTQMPDGQTLVDREAVAEYLPQEIKSSVLSRMEESASAVEQRIEELTEIQEQTVEELQAIIEESQSNDEQTFSIIDDITSTLEEVNKQILQLREEYDRLEEEQRREEERNKIETDAYNQGYTDAERILTPEGVMSGDPLEMGEMGVDDDPLSDPVMDEEEMITDDLGEDELIPDDVLEDIEGMSDEELALLLEQYPQLAELLR